MPKKIVPPPAPANPFAILTRQMNRITGALTTEMTRAQSSSQSIAQDHLASTPELSNAAPISMTFDATSLASNSLKLLAQSTVTEAALAPVPMMTPLALGDLSTPLEVMPGAKAPDAAGDKVRKAVELLLRVSCNTQSVKRLLSLPNAATTTQAALFIMGQTIYARYKLRGAIDEGRLTIANKLLQFCAQLLDAGVDIFERTALPSVDGVCPSGVLHKTIPQIAGLFVDVEVTRLLLDKVPNVVSNVDICRVAIKMRTQDSGGQAYARIDDRCVAFPIIEEAVKSRLLRGHLRAASEITKMITAETMQAISSESEAVQNECMASLGQSMIGAEIAEMVRGMVLATADTPDGTRHLDSWLGQAALRGRTNILRVLLGFVDRVKNDQAIRSQLNLSTTGFPGLLSMVVEQPKLSRMRIKEVCTLLIENGFDPRAIYNSTQTINVFSPAHEPAGCAAIINDADLARFVAQKQRESLTQSSAEHAAQFKTLGMFVESVPSVIQQGQTQELRDALIAAQRYVRIIHANHGFGHYCEASADILQALAPIDSDIDLPQGDSAASHPLQQAAAQMTAAIQTAIPDVDQRVMQGLTTAMRALSNGANHSLSEINRVSPKLSAGSAPSGVTARDALTFEDYHRIFHRVKRAIEARLDPNDTSLATRRARIKHAIESIPQLQTRLMRHYGALLSFVCSQQNRPLKIYVESGAPFSLSSLAHAFFLAAQHTLYPPKTETSPAPNYAETRALVMQAARTSDQALVLLHTAIIVGSVEITQAVISHIQTHKIDISPLFEEQRPDILHQAIEGGAALVELLAQVAGPALMQAWVADGNGARFSTLFVASRHDSASIAYLLSCVQDTDALASCIGSDGRTIIEDALYFNSIKVLRALWALPAFGFDADALTEIEPSIRSILVTGPKARDEKALHALRRIPEGSALLRIASPDLLKEALRDNNDAMMRFVLQHFASYVSVCRPDHTNVLQVLASCDADFALRPIELSIRPDERRQMARARHRGLRAESLTNNENIAATLVAWRHWMPQSETPDTPSPPSGLSALAKNTAKREVRAEQTLAHLWANKVRTCTTRPQQESLMQEFISHAKAQCAKADSDEVFASVVREGWEVIDTLDVYGLGHVFGRHYARHHHKLSPDTLRARLSSGAVDGSSQFGALDSIGLIEARLRAQSLVMAVPEHAAMERCVVHVRQDNLSGAGFVLDAATQMIKTFEHSRTLRFVFRHDSASERLNIISCFPVPDAAVGPHLLDRVLAAQA